MELRYKRQGECNRCGDCCVNENCEHFEVGSLATCKIYDSPDRPLKCRLFPEMPSLKPNKRCGYYFLDTWEDNRRVEA